MNDILNFIDGEFIIPHSGKYIDDINPATGEVIGRIASSESQDVQTAVDAASDSLKSWSSLSMENRVIWLNKIADALELNKELIAKTESQDTGKPISLARRVDANRSVSNFRFFAQFASDQTPMEFKMDDAMNFVKLVI